VCEFEKEPSINDLAEEVQVMDELGGVTLVGRWEPGGGGVVRGAMRWIPGRWFSVKPSGSVVVIKV
jgi:hypothetical protein